MFELIVVVFILIFVSFLCSILESVILSLTEPYIQLLIEKKNKSGKILEKLNQNIEEPITAILTLNTISHTTGATISGAIALQLFGSKWMALFSAILTFLILILSEIIPKTIGARHWKLLSPLSGYILRVMVFLMKPFILPMNFLTKFLSKSNDVDSVSKREIFNFMKIGFDEGVIELSEFEIIDNLFKLNKIKVKEIMTPRTVVFWLSPDTKIKEIIEKKIKLNFSRILLYDPSTNHVKGVVLRRDIMDEALVKKKNLKLESISSKPIYVPETLSVYKLLNQLVLNKNHLSVVVNEYGDYVGIVTLEDAIETLLGLEIVDEFDHNVDMRKLAINKKANDKRFKK